MQATRWMAALTGLAAVVYAAYVGTTWYRYGHVSTPANADDEDELLDRFMPDYEVVERHRGRIAAPAALTFMAARNMDLFRSPSVRALLKTRELLLGAEGEQRRPRGLVDEVLSLGWGVLVEIPGREIVIGSVTKPWEPHVTFRRLPAEEFAAFSRAGLCEDRLDAQSRSAQRI